MNRKFHQVNLPSESTQISQSFKIQRIPIRFAAFRKIAKDVFSSSQWLNETPHCYVFTRTAPTRHILFGLTEVQSLNPVNPLEKRRILFRNHLLFFEISFSSKFLSPQKFRSRLKLPSGPKSPFLLFSSISIGKIQLHLFASRSKIGTSLFFCKSENCENRIFKIRQPNEGTRSVVRIRAITAKPQPCTIFINYLNEKKLRLSPQQSSIVDFIRRLHSSTSFASTGNRLAGDRLAQ